MAESTGVVNLIAEFTAKAGSEDELLRAMTTLVSDTLTEAGCERFELLRARDNPRRLILVERFRDAAAFQEHMDAPYVKEFLNGQVPDLVDQRSASHFEQIS